MHQFITRFAPSPNGYLHLGHAYSALTAYRAAQNHGGQFLLRIDDIDTSRARGEFIDAIYTDLRWLGITWPEPVRIQSAHLNAYDAAAQKLVKLGVTYPCFCTRKTITLDKNGHYAGTCKALSPGDIAENQARGLRPAIRLDAQKALQYLFGNPLTYRDTGKTLSVDAQPLDDAILVRKDIGSSYLLSCVIDDAAQHISHVIRGRDIQALTPLQVLLQALLGLPTPLYEHHDLITDEAQKKLSKSAGAPSLKAMRQAGVRAQSILKQLGFSRL